MLAPSTNSQKSDADLALTSALAAALLPHFQVALTTTAADTEAALALELMKRSASVPVLKRLAATPVSKPSSPPLQVAPPLPPGAVPRYSIRRDITCATYLRRLHVTGEMVRRRGRRVWESRGQAFFLMLISLHQAANLLPDMNLHVPLSAMRHQSNQSFFKRGIDLVDSHGSVHKLTYECLVSSGQRHARLSAGWGPAMRRMQACIGDTVLLHLYGDRNDGVLHVQLERACQY